jgi:hypothetical protein
MGKKLFWKDKIPFLKKSKQFFEKLDYRGINLWPVMAGEVYTFQSSPINNKLEKFLMIVKFLFTMDKFNIEGERNRILVSYPISREDHHNLLIKSIEKFPKNEITLLDNYYWKKEGSFFKYIFRFPDLKLLFKLWKKFKKNDMKRVFGKNYLYFLTRTYFRHKQIEALERIYVKFNPRAYIAFCSPAFAEDTILTLIAKKDKKPTFTLEHGFAPNFSNFSPVFIINENMVSDYLLLWGKKNYDLQKNYIDKSKLLVVGNPKYDYNDYNRKRNLNFKPKVATFFFSVIGFEQSNEKIIKILNNFAKKHSEIQFNMKLHPFDSSDKYESYIDSENIKFVSKDMAVKDLLEKSDFIVTHNTSVAYESLFYRIPIFRFNDKVSLKVWEDFDTFRNDEEFEELFNKLKNKKFLSNNLEKYEILLKNSFYFEKDKDPSQVYYEKILEIIKRKEAK